MNVDKRGNVVLPALLRIRLMKRVVISGYVGYIASKEKALR